jgi:hypothetical protein
MVDKKKEKPTPKPETKEDKKASETVHLSAEDLRKISGGAGVISGTNPRGSKT